MPDPSIFTSIINSYLPEPHASLLNGIIFGIPLRTSREFYQQIKTVGLLHIVVLSGTNITILAAIIGALTRRFSKSISIMLTILMIIVFIIFVGPQAPIIRAGVMGILTLVAIIYGRKNIAIYSLFLSLLFTIIFKFDWIKTISLQLSYGATLGIILFGTAVIKPNNNWWSKILSDIKKDIRLSIAAQIFTIPIIFFYFKQISLIGILSIVFVSPLIAPLMIFGFITSILGKIHFFLGLIPSYICFIILDYMVKVIEILSKIPFGFVSFK